MGASDDTVAGTSSAEGSTATGTTDGTQAETETQTGDPCTSDEDCAGDLPFCGQGSVCVACDAMPDPDGACTEASADEPVCFEGACVACTAEKAGACSGSTPACGEDHACRACEEHVDCPDSACHLAGSDRGACFDVSEVTEVASAAELNAALSSVAGSNRAVIRVVAGDYIGVTAELLSSVEVAIIGVGSPTISGNTVSGIFAVGSSAILYVSDVALGPNGSGHGVACSGHSVWLDDVRIRNSAQAGVHASLGCEAHLRRVMLRANQDGAIAASGNATRVVIQNSALVANNNGEETPAIGLNSGADIDMTYSTVVGNLAGIGSIDSLACSASSTGSVRNSIITSQQASSIGGCGTVSFEHNALDTEGLGATNENIGAYDSTWFAGPASGDVRLTETGATELLGVAQWQPGDPRTDVDGTPIPAEAASHPGYHQP